MTKDIKEDILTFMTATKLPEYSIPDFQKGLKIKNRERLIKALTELVKDGKIISREKGKGVLYHLVNHG